MLNEMMALMMGAKMLITLAVYVALGALQSMREGNDVMQQLSTILVNGIVFVVVLTVVLLIASKMGINCG